MIYEKIDQIKNLKFLMNYNLKKKLEKTVYTLIGSLLREARIQTEMKLFKNSIDLVIMIIF